MENRPLITIAMPVYNVEKYVEKALLSALNQTYENLEILIIDDKGTDSSMVIVNKLISSHPRGNCVKIIDHVTNRGTGATKNSAIDNARGEFLFFMDSDDYIAENCIETLYSKVDDTVGIVIGSYQDFNKNGVIRNHKILPDHAFDDDTPYHNFLVTPGSYVQTWNKLYRVSLLKSNSIRCIPSNTYEDIYFSFQMLYVMTKIVTTHDITYFYRVDNDTSATACTREKGVNHKMIAQLTSILNHIYKEVKDGRFKITYPAVRFFISEKHYIISVIMDSDEKQSIKKYLINSIGKYPLMEKSKFSTKSIFLLVNSMFPSYYSHQIYSQLVKVRHLIKQSKTH